jgi:hypothetical protein
MTRHEEVQEARRKYLEAGCPTGFCSLCGEAIYGELPDIRHVVSEDGRCGAPKKVKP